MLLSVQRQVNHLPCKEAERHLYEYWRGSTCFTWWDSVYEAVDDEVADVLVEELNDVLSSGRLDT